MKLASPAAALHPQTRGRMAGAHAGNKSMVAPGGQFGNTAHPRARGKGAIQVNKIIHLRGTSLCGMGFRSFDQSKQSPGALVAPIADRRSSGTPGSSARPAPLAHRKSARAGRSRCRAENGIARDAVRGTGRRAAAWRWACRRRSWLCRSCSRFTAPEPLAPSVAGRGAWTAAEVRRVIERVA